MISQQLVYFKYNDSNATMLTLGWIVYKKGDIDKFTIVIWLEGDDPDCVDNILGGEIKMHMEIREEHKEESKNMPNVVYPIEGADFLEEEEVNAYRKIYKYYPPTFETSIAL